MRLRPRDGAVAAAIVALIAAAPLTKLHRPSSALQAEAAAITVVVLAGLLAGAFTGGWRALVGADRLSVCGLALYGAAAVQGAAVALLRGNQTIFVVGQFLSMILLPLGAMVGLTLSRRGAWRPFATAIAGAAGVACIVQLVLTLPAAVVAPAGFRFLLPNVPSSSGIAPLGLFLATALAWHGRWPTRAAAFAVAGATVVVIAGSGIRSQWLALPFGVVVYAAVAFGRARILSRRVVATAVGVAALAALGLSAAAWWWVAARPSLADSGATARLDPGPPLALRLHTVPRGLLRVRGLLTCEGTGRVTLTARQEPAPASGTPGAPEATEAFVCSPSTSNLAMIVVPTPPATGLILDLHDPARLGGAVSAITVEDLRPRLLAELAYHVQALLARPPDPGEIHRSDAFSGDASIAFRLREMQAIAAELRRSGLALLIFGHGLGATFPLDTLGYDSHGHIQTFRQPNYIHNFFMFLPFKLGAVGTAAVLGALTIWIAAAVAGARARATGSADRHFFAAAAASWVTYTVWSAAAPEILDFRMAAIWGMVAAAVATARLVPPTPRGDHRSRERDEGTSVPGDAQG